jgi:transposase
LWVPPEEKDPIIRHAPTRKSMALFGAVSADTGEMVTMDTTIFNAETFLQFLQKVIRSKKRGKKIILILDNARYHHATMIQPRLTKRKDKIQLLFLPPYSPDLNNIERVWKMTSQKYLHT